jgi:hypothetical protein
MVRRALAATIVVALFSARYAVAQSVPPEDHAPGDKIIGMTIGVPGYGRQAQPDFLVLGLNALHARPSQLGIDFALGTIPRTLSAGAVALGGRVDGVLPIAVSRDLWLMPVAGGSMIGGGGADGGAAYPGVNAGIGAILWSGHFGFRTSVTWHRFTDTRGAIWLAEFGFVGGK